MMQVLLLLWLMKWHVSGQTEQCWTLKNLKLYTLLNYVFSQSVSWLTSQFLENTIKQVISNLQSYSIIFSLLQNISESSMKSISTINPANMENVWLPKCAPQFSIKCRYVLWSWRIVTLRFQLLQTFWVTFQEKKSIGSASTSTTLTLKQ